MAQTGLSTGDSALRAIAVHPARVAELEEFARAVKGLCAGETVTWRGTELVLRWGSHPAPPVGGGRGATDPVPGRSDRRRRHPVQRVDAEVMAQARANVEAGAASVGRSADDIGLVHGRDVPGRLGSARVGQAEVPPGRYGQPRVPLPHGRKGRSRRARPGPGRAPGPVRLPLPRHARAGGGECRSGGGAGSGRLPGPPIGHRRAPRALCRADPSDRPGRRHQPHREPVRQRPVRVHAGVRPRHLAASVP